MLNFLAKDTLKTWMDTILMPSEATEKLLEIAKNILENDILTKEYEKYSNEVSKYDCDWDNYSSNPEFNTEVSEILGDETSLLYLLAYLSALPTTKQKYQEKNIPMDIFVKTMSDMVTWVKNFNVYYNHYGLSNFYWIANHLSFKIFYLGRLQYIHKKYDDEGIVLKNNNTNEFVIVCPKDFKLRPDGYASGAGNDTEEEVVLTEYIETDSSIIANKVSFIGVADLKPTEFKKSDYSIYMQKGDYYLEIHIPREGSFTRIDCRNSILEAFEFYKTYFNDATYKAVGTHTWLFSAQLPDLCGETSKIVDFQNQFYRFPCKGSKGFLWGFVFGPHIKEENAREFAKTSLQIKVLDWLDSGNEIFDMLGYWFLDFDKGFSK